MNCPRTLAALGVSCIFAAATTASAIGPPAEYFGPDPYTSSDDSPFDIEEFGFCIETFEDNAYDVPGATSNGSVESGSGATDSVDADDGVIDGSGLGGHSRFSGNGLGGISVEFDPNRTHGLPTRVGIVWTDGGGGVTFEAFGPDGLTLLGPNGPNLHADGSNSGTTDEDRFYGAFHAAGISKVTVSNTSGGIEVDHIQLDRCILCGDATLDLHLTASDALVALKTSVGTDECRLCLCDTNDSTSTTATDALAILKKSVGLSPTMNCPPCDELNPP